MSVLATNAITDASGGNTATINGYAPTLSNMAGRNRIINGDMRIDQRNAGASVTTSASYPVDRFKIAFLQSTLTAQQSTVVPSGFTNSLQFTNGTGITPAAGETNGFWQSIEGFNISDLAQGTAGASSFTLSFWVRSSVAGKYAGRFFGATNSSYVFNYSISQVNTWEYKTVTIPGATTGTWDTTNGTGLQLWFDLGSSSDFNTTADVWTSGNLTRTSDSVTWRATSGATFYITGVQLEAGSVATPFEHVDYGEMLRRCQRYCVLLGGTDGETHVGAGLWYSTTATVYQMRLPVEMRAAPVLTNVSPTVAMYTQGSALYGAAPTLNSVSKSSVEFYTAVSSGSTTAGSGTSVRYTAGKSLLTSEL